MYDPPAYLWAITIAGPAAVFGLTDLAVALHIASLSALARAARAARPATNPLITAAAK